MAASLTGTAEVTHTAGAASVTMPANAAGASVGDTVLVFIVTSASPGQVYSWNPANSSAGTDAALITFKVSGDGNNTTAWAAKYTETGSSWAMPMPSDFGSQDYRVVVAAVSGESDAPIDVVAWDGDGYGSITPTTPNALVVGWFWDESDDIAGVTNSDSTAEYASGTTPEIQVMAAWAAGVATSAYTMNSHSSLGTGTIVGDGHVLVAIGADNNPPDAPNPTYPIGSEDVDVAGAITLLWDFSDPDSGDTQSAYEVEWKVNAGSATSTTKTTSTSSQHTFSAATFSDGDTVEWRAKTWDAADTEGPWSSWVTFDGIDAPAAPTPSSPADEASIAVDSVTLEWTHAGTPDNYEARLLADDAGSPGDQVATSGTQSWDTEHTFTGLDNSTTYHWQVRAQESGLWSSWSTAREFSVEFDAPAVPTLAATVDDENDTITWTITNPTPTGDEPDVETWDLYLRVASGGRVDLERTVADDGVRVLAGAPVATTSWVDPWPRAGTVYEARAKVYGDNDTSSWSAWTS